MTLNVNSEDRNSTDRVVVVGGARKAAFWPYQSEINRGNGNS